MSHSLRALSRMKKTREFRSRLWTVFTFSIKQWLSPMCKSCQFRHCPKTLSLYTCPIDCMEHWFLLCKHPANKGKALITQNYCNPSRFFSTYSSFPLKGSYNHSPSYVASFKTSLRPIINNNIAQKVPILISRKIQTPRAGIRPFGERNDVGSDVSSDADSGGEWDVNSSQWMSRFERRSQYQRMKMSGPCHPRHSSSRYRVRIAN